MVKYTMFLNRALVPLCENFIAHKNTWHCLAY